MHVDLEKFVKAGKIPAEFAARLDHFSPGKYVMHGDWGVGKVVAWSLPKQMVKIDFEKKAGYTLGLKLAFNQLTIIPDKHFLTQCYEKPEEFRAEAEDKDKILGFIRFILAHNYSLREGINEVLPMQPDDLERSLSGRIIPSNQWKAWWEKARTAMRDDPSFRLPTKRGEAITLRNASSTAEALLDDYQAATNLEACVRVLDQIRWDDLDGEWELIAKLLSSMEQDIIKDRSEPQRVLELIITRNEIMEYFSTNESKKEALEAALNAAGITVFTTLADKVKSIASKDIVEYIYELSEEHQRKIYEALPEALGDKWLAYAINLCLFAGTPNLDGGKAARTAKVSTGSKTPRVVRATTIAAKYIIEKGEKEQLFTDILNDLARQKLTPDMLYWLCANRDGLSKDVVEKSQMALGSAILNAIERDSVEGGRSKALDLRNLLIEDKNLATDLVSGLSEPEARPFAKGLYDASMLPELDRNLLLANMMKIHPGLQEVVLTRTKNKEKQITFVSLRSFAARKAEYEELVNVRIPQNKRDLEITRAEGDLRENGGYQDAKATRQVLMRRSEELSRQLAQAEPTDFRHVDLSLSGMGTQITLRSEQGEEYIYTILGAWDSVPEERIVSYNSRQGQALSGLELGASLRLVVAAGTSPAKLKITKIEAAPTALIFPDSEVS